MTLPHARTHAQALIIGAHQGVGRCLAQTLARMGHHLLLVGEQRSILETLAGELQQNHRVKVEVLPTELSQERERAALISELEQRDINILIQATTPTTLEQLTTTYQLIQAVLPRMRQHQEGAICTLAPVARQTQGEAALVQGALENYHKALHQELLPHHINCTLAMMAYSAPDAEIPSGLHRIPWISHSDAARSIIEALAGNSRRSTPGLGTKSYRIAQKIIPTRLWAAHAPANPNLAGEPR